MAFSPAVLPIFYFLKKKRKGFSLPSGLDKKFSFFYSLYAIDYSEYLGLMDNANLECFRY